MNILFLTLSPNVDVNDSQAIYGSVIHELLKHNNVYVVSPIERRYKEKTNIIEEENYKVLRVKTGNIQKTNIIEKGIATLLIEKQFKRAIKNYFKNVKFDLILYTTPPITFYNVIKYFKKINNARTYLMLKDIFPQNAVDLGMFSKKSILYKFFRRKEINLYKISDKIGCMSPKNEEYLLSNNSYLNSDIVEIFPNSINPNEINKRNLEKNIEYRNKYGIPLDSKVFMYGGNLGKPQGIPFVIECLNKVKDIKEAYFVICGKGTEYKKIEEFKNSNKLDNILLIEGLPKQEYLEFLNIADIGLIFLDYRFTIPNFPSRLLSYMEKGIPILSCTDKNTDVGDIIENNNFGWKCYSNDSEEFCKIVKKIVEIDKFKINELGSNGFRYLLNNYNSIDNVKMIF